MNYFKFKHLNFKTFTNTLLCIICLLSFTACSKETKITNNFNYWNKDSQSLQTLVNYVEDVTNINSDNYIPNDGRIAVFDMDGTIIGELAPSYIVYLMFINRVEELGDAADEEMKNVAKELSEDIQSGTYRESVENKEITQEPRAYAGMTLEEFNDYVNRFLAKPVEGFSNMTYGQSTYKPMLEVIDYLNENGFTVYLTSGSDRYACRAIVDYAGINIKENHIIGSDVLIEVNTDNEFIRNDEYVSYNWEEVKVTQIIQEIGKQPVLMFGNSNGDKDMALYTINNNPHKAAAFMLIADDEKRDYGDSIKAEEKQVIWEKYGFNVISMKNDFKTIYGEDVEKTGREN